MTSPERRARKTIDQRLNAAGWHVQDYAELNLAAARGVAVREFPLRTGFADYLLFVDRKAIGAVEAKAAGTPLSGVELQSEKYSAGLPDIPPAWHKPLPFLYESTGVETFFTNGLDPEPRSRRAFAQNLVMEYPRQRAVADGVNVDGEVYRIRTAITERGSRVEAGYYVDRRDRLTRDVRWEQLDEDLEYQASELDRQVVSESQIRTVVRAFRDKLFTEIFPGRAEVPKTLIFAKDDSHAEDIVRIVREEFGRGNEFCQKITYRVAGVNTEDLIASFRNSFNPRIAVSVDMISTGTDIKPLEVLLFMRPVQSRVLFEQMLGRGTRVISSTDLQAVTPDATVKDHFVIVDAVGVVEHPKADTQSLERKRSVSFKKLLNDVALGVRDDDTLTTLAGRLARLERRLTEQDQYSINAVSGGRTLRDLANALLDAVDPDKHLEAARAETGSQTPAPQQIQQAVERLVDQAVEPFFTSPQLRNTLIEVHQRSEQIIDTVSVDQVREARFDETATERARATVASFQEFIEEHRDEITALQILYSQPYGRQRLNFQHIKDLAGRLEQSPFRWTAEALWRAYAQLEQDRVRGVGAKRVLTDLVSLVRHAVQLDDDWCPTLSWCAGATRPG